MKIAHQNIYLFSVNCASVINGKIGFCACHSCLGLEGDCDFNDQCQEGLRCGSNNCPASLGFDAYTDCCYDKFVGSEDFCTIDEPCEVDEGDCDSNDECKSHLYCGSKNCHGSLGFLSSVDCCIPKGDTTVLVMFRSLSIWFGFFFQLLTESCAINYCQDGLQVLDFATETQHYVHFYGHYELQPDSVDGRPYFKMGIYGIWFDSDWVGWFIGYHKEKGTPFCLAYIENDGFCPNQLPQEWWVYNGFDWYRAFSDLEINCKCIFIFIKTKQSEFYIKG